MTREQLIAAARTRLADHGSSSPVMREVKAVLEALDESEALSDRNYLMALDYGERFLEMRATTIEECAKVCDAEVERICAEWICDAYGAEMCATAIRGMK